MNTLTYLLVTISLAEVKPLQTAIEYAFGDETATVVETISDMKDLFGNGLWYL